MALASTFGLIIASFTGSGARMRWTALEYISTLMKSDMTVSIKKTRKTAMAFTAGRMDANMKAGGHVESNMAMEFIQIITK
jgi:hypothetical protein